MLSGSGKIWDRENSDSNDFSEQQQLCAQILKPTFTTAGKGRELWDIITTTTAHLTFPRGTDLLKVPLSLLVQGRAFFKRQILL
jgi:hypothetical protein